MYNRCDENFKPSEEYKDEILNLNRFHNEVSLCALNQLKQNTEN